MSEVIGIGAAVITTLIGVIKILWDKNQRLQRELTKLHEARYQDMIELLTDVEAHKARLHEKRK